MLDRLLRTARVATFRGSGRYWRRRYEVGGNSGPGSSGVLGKYKAAVINEFVARSEPAITSVIEFGCGDGRQASLFKVPRYLGLDIAPAAVAACVRRFRDDASKTFLSYDPRCYLDNAGFLVCDLGLSLDVIYHLVEDEVFETYMDLLFGASRRYVLVYSTNFDDRPSGHVRHRNVVAWVEGRQRGWFLDRVMPNPHPYRGDILFGSSAEFMLFGKKLTS